MIVIGGSLGQLSIGSLTQQSGKSREQRPEGKKTTADTKAERELKEPEPWAKARPTAAPNSPTARPSLQSIAPPAAPAKPVESEIRDEGAGREIEVPKSEVSTMAPRRDVGHKGERRVAHPVMPAPPRGVRRPPDPAPPQATRESRDDAGNDPDAIIDWLLKEGASKER